jgi:hypothetical protein
MRSASILYPVPPSNGGVDEHIPRRRMGHLAIPRQVAELTPSDEPALECVNAFVDRLVDLPFFAWLAIGQSVSSQHDGLPVRLAARDALDIAIVDHGLGVPAWYVRDAVETAAFLAARRVSPWSRRERALFSAAHGTAATAALALLARAHLPAAMLRTLSISFAGYIADS